MFVEHYRLEEPPLGGGAVLLMRPFRIRQSRMRIGKCGPHFCRFERK